MDFFLIYLIPVCVLDSQVYLVLYKMVLMMVIRFDLIYQSLYVGNLSSDVGKWSHLGGCLGHWGGPFTGEMNGFVIWERTPYGRVNAASSSLPPNCVLKHKCDDASCLVMALQHRLHRMPSPWYLILDAQVTRIVRKNCDNIRCHLWKLYIRKYSMSLWIKYESYGQSFWYVSVRELKIDINISYFNLYWLD